MAIFGNLRDIGLLDLLPMLSHQRGKLVLIRREGNLALYLAGGRIECAEEGGRPLSPTQLEERLFEILHSQDAGFEFFRGEAPRHGKGCIRIPVEELVLKLATLRDELEHARENLPLPDTVFTLGNVALAYGDPSLAEFLDRAWPQLTQGASARSLAKQLDLPIERVRYLLYKLRSLGAILPKTKTPRATRERKSLAVRLLGLLRRRFGSVSWNL